MLDHSFWLDGTHSVNCHCCAGCLRSVLCCGGIKALRSVMRLKAAQTFFNRPVDPDALGIPEYRQIVKV